jgi:hypothetical protein
VRDGSCAPAPEDGIYGIMCIKDTYVVCKYVKKTHMLYVNMLKREYFVWVVRDRGCAPAPE